jgi:hypothetical protein
MPLAKNKYELPHPTQRVAGPEEQIEDSQFDSFSSLVCVIYLRRPKGLQLCKVVASPTPQGAVATVFQSSVDDRLATAAVQFDE